MPLAYVCESHDCELSTRGSAFAGATDGFIPFPRGIGGFCLDDQDALNPVEPSSTQMNSAPPI